MTLTNLQAAIIGWLTIVTLVGSMLGAIVKYCIRPMMIAIGELLDSTKTIAEHSKRLTMIERKLDQIERNTHNGSS